VPSMVMARCTSRLLSLLASSTYATVVGEKVVRRDTRRRRRNTSLGFLASKRIIKWKFPSPTWPTKGWPTRTRTRTRTTAHAHAPNNKTDVRKCGT
jgi:hypothetical protein